MRAWRSKTSASIPLRLRLSWPDILDSPSYFNFSSSLPLRSFLVTRSAVIRVTDGCDSGGVCHPQSRNGRMEPDEVNPEVLKNSDCTDLDGQLFRWTPIEADINCFGQEPRFGARCCFGHRPRRIRLPNFTNWHIDSQLTSPAS